MNIVTEQAVHDGFRKIGVLLEGHDNGIRGSIVCMMLVRNINKMYRMDEKGIVKCKSAHH